MLTMSSRSGSWLTQNFRHVLQILGPTRNTRFEPNHERFQRNSLIISGSKLGSGFSMHPGVNFFSTNGSTGSDSNGGKSVKVKSPVASAASFSFSGWLRWVFGSALSFLIAFSNNWQKLRRIEGEAEIVVEEAEKIANVVEKVATMAEKVAEDVSENLSDESTLKSAALMVDKISKQAAHDAHLTQEFLHKVDEVKNDLDDLESIVEPIIDNISKKESHTK